MTVADEAREFVQMYVDGKSIGQISQLVGKTPGTVKWQLVKNGVKLRSRAEGIRMATQPADGGRRAVYKEYTAWIALRDRCKNPNNAAFHNYGGRGIKVCERWDNSFENFLADVGRAPSSEHSFDRYPNNNGDYEPGNVRWATSREQANNVRRNRIIEFNGRSQTLSEWAREKEIPVNSLHRRLNTGWPLERALNEPLVTYRKKLKEDRHERC